MTANVGPNFEEHVTCMLKEFIIVIKTAEENKECAESLA